MKVTLGDIFFAQEGLVRLLAMDTFAAKVGIRIARLAKKIQGELKLIEEKRNELVKKYSNGKMDDNGLPQVAIKLENDEPNPAFKDFSDEFKELLEEPVELSVEKVMLPEDSKIPVKVLLDLEPFLSVHTVD